MKGFVLFDQQNPPYPVPSLDFRRHLEQFNIQENCNWFHCTTARWMFVLVNHLNVPLGKVEFERQEQHVCFIRWICAKRGFGSRLLRRVEKWARDNGCRIVALNSNLSNEESSQDMTRRLQFYQKHKYAFKSVVHGAGVVIIRREKVVVPAGH